MVMYGPWSEMEALRNEVERAFARAFSGNGGSASIAFLPGRAARAYPLLNVSEDADNIYVQALAPGIDPKSIDATLQNNSLTLAGEKLPPQNIKPEAFHRNERAAGKFVRSIQLPVEVDINRIQANYQDGLLTITLPKSEVAKPRRISVAVQ